jgi:hypothetical protein
VGGISAWPRRVIARGAALSAAILGSMDRQRARRYALWTVFAGCLAFQAATGKDPRYASADGVACLAFFAAALGLFVPWARRHARARRARAGIPSASPDVRAELAELREQVDENGRKLTGYDQMFRRLGRDDPPTLPLPLPPLRVLRGGRESGRDASLLSRSGAGHRRPGGRRGSNGSRPA